MRTWKILIALGGLVALGAGGLAADAILSTNDSARALPAAEAPQTPAPDAGKVTRVALGEAKPSDHVIGDPDAPITVVEYASLTCPHCATFHQETLPKLKENFIAPGKVKLVFRHYPLDKRALRAAMLTECFEGDRFFTVLGILFKQQQRWAQAENPDEHFRKLGGMAGLSPDKVNACLNDGATRDAILQRQLKAREQAGIRSTPSFIVDGETVAGNPGYEALAEKLRQAGS
jgi:protein-disulfide isomerase